MPDPYMYITGLQISTDQKWEPEVRWCMWMIPEQGLSYTLPHDYPTIKLTQVRNTMKHNNLNPVADKKIGIKIPECHCHCQQFGGAPNHWVCLILTYFRQNWWYLEIRNADLTFNCIRVLQENASSACEWCQGNVSLTPYPMVILQLSWHKFITLWSITM